MVDVGARATALHQCSDGPAASTAPNNWWSTAPRPAWTTSDDVENSKPEPDLVGTALEKVEGASGLMIGDSTWDCVAAAKLGVPSVAVRTGGFSVEELIEAGASRVFESLRAFANALDDTPLARPEQ